MELYSTGVSRDVAQEFCVQPVGLSAIVFLELHQRDGVFNTSMKTSVGKQHLSLSFLA